MDVSNGRIVAKSGAEGLLCLALPERGVGVAIRILDGSFRAHPEVAIATLRQLELVEPAVLDALAERHPPALRNHAGRPVGDIRAAFAFRSC